MLFADYDFNTFLLLIVMVVMNGHLVIQAWIAISLNLTLQGMKVKHLCHLNFHLDLLLQALNQNHLDPEDKELCHRALLPKQL